MKTHYERRLPHIVPPGATLFFTLRLAGSIAAAAWQQLFGERELAMRAALKQTEISKTELISRLQKRHFAACNTLLDQAGYGPTWLREVKVAELLVRELHALTELGVVLEQIPNWCTFFISILQA